jgi:hypothetical protein
VMNRVKPHTDFSGSIESGRLKMITIGLGKAAAREAHRWFWRFMDEFQVTGSGSERVSAVGICQESHHFVERSNVELCERFGMR